MKRWLVVSFKFDEQIRWRWELAKSELCRPILRKLCRCIALSISLWKVQGDAILHFHLFAGPRALNDVPNAQELQKAKSYQGHLWVFFIINVLSTAVAWVACVWHWKSANWFHMSTHFLNVKVVEILNFRACSWLRLKCQRGCSDRQNGQQNELHHF